MSRTGTPFEKALARRQTEENKAEIAAKQRAYREENKAEIAAKHRARARPAAVTLAPLDPEPSSGPD